MVGEKDGAPESAEADFALSLPRSQVPVSGGAREETPLQHAILILRS